MNNSTHRALVQELLFIKTAAILPPTEPERGQFKHEVWKQFLRNIGAGSLGYGVGLGGSYALSAGLDKIWPRGMAPNRLGLLRQGAGFLGAVSSMSGLAALAAAQHKIEEARKKQQGVFPPQAELPTGAEVRDIHERE